MNGSWTPTGDDTTWVYTVQAYDSLNRPTVTTNSDGSTRETSYSGCGCAGGDVMTVRDEAGRRRRMTMDVLGRLAGVAATPNVTFINRRNSSILQRGLSASPVPARHN